MGSVIALSVPCRKVALFQFLQLMSKIAYPGVTVANNSPAYPSIVRVMSAVATSGIMGLLGLLGFHSSITHAADYGVASMGAIGGLHIPSAYTLDNGEAALSLGNHQDPRLGTFRVRENYSLGFGLLPGLEVFGRFAEYQNPPPANYWGFNVAGPRDISANLKWQIPLNAPGLPKIALGATDLSGGAVYFQSYYAVASDTVGPFRWSVGYAREGNKRVPPLSGAFGGVEMRLGQTRATLLAETDGLQKNVGLRYYSEALPWLGHGQIVGSVQRAFGSSLPAAEKTATSWQLSLVVPMGESGAAKKQQELALTRQALRLPALDEEVLPDANTPTMRPTIEDQLAGMARALRSLGFERLRVGVMQDTVVVAYENRRYLHNEVDALGIVLGVVAERAPKHLQQIQAISMKAGQAMTQTTVDRQAMRRFLRSGYAAEVRSSLRVQNSTSLDKGRVSWVDERGVAKTTLLRLELSPLLNNTLGTEYGAFDYSLALKARASTDLWTGATVYADVVQRLANSDSMEPGMVYGGSRHKNGLKTVAVQQSLWLGPTFFASVGVGRFNYAKDDGLEGQAIYYLPWRDDSVQLLGSSMRHRDLVIPRFEQALQAKYRFNLNTNTWLEAGYQRFTDRTSGPTLALRRWFGDTEVQVFARKGGDNTFVGLALSIPLTPRQSMKANWAQVNGTPRIAHGVQTRMANGSGNWVLPNAVAAMNLSFKPEVEHLNAGRLGHAYYGQQLARMREAFLEFAWPVF